MKCETVFSELTNEFLFWHGNTLDSLPNDKYTRRHTRRTLAHTPTRSLFP